MSVSTQSVSVTKSLIKLFIAFSAVLLLSPNFANAQGVGVSIRPAKIEGGVEPGEIKEQNITIENLSGLEQTYYLFTRNISGVEAGGIPVFAQNSDEKTGFEVSDWVEISESQITVAGGSSVSVGVKITVPENASPGSHFGGIFVSVEPPKLENSGAAVGYQVASIVNLRVAGEVQEDASIRQFSTSKFIYSTQNVEFLVRIENSGNVLVQPRGPLEIFNMLGNKVDTITFNETEAGVFPFTTRDFDKLIWERDSVGFGRYEAILSPVYGQDGAKKTMSSTVSFWILPMNIIGPALGVLAFILLITFIFVKLYIKRSLQHLNHERRLVRRRNKGGNSGMLILSITMLLVTALFLIVLLALFA